MSEYSAEHIRFFAAAILHGDDEHRRWLSAAAEAYIAGQAIPAASGKGRSEAEILRLQSVVAKMRETAQVVFDLMHPDLCETTELHDAMSALGEVFDLTGRTEGTTSK